MLKRATAHTMSLVSILVPNALIAGLVRVREALMEKLQSLPVHKPEN